MKRIFCFLCVLLLLFFNSVSVFAVAELPGDVLPGGGGFPLSEELTEEITDFSNHVFDKWLEGLHNGERLVYNGIRSLFDDDVCALCPDASGRHSFVSQHTQVNGQTGQYYICEYCGKSAGEVLEEAEQEYVASLPAQTVTSDGGLIWHVSLDDVVEDVSFRLCGSNSFTLSSPNYSYSESVLSLYKYEILPSIHSFAFHADAFRMAWSNYYAGFSTLKFNAPVDGMYTRLETDYILGFSFFGSEHSNLNYAYSSDFHYYNSGDVINISYSKSIRCDADASYVIEYTAYLPVFSVTPLTAYNVSSTSDDDTYNIGTRASSITGNYGIVNSNGTVTQVESQSIVNEGDSTVYNPVTNETSSISDWSYDYSDRSYHITTEEGDNITVTYGDENVTIQEGDTVYNVYYITNTTNNGGNDTPDNPPSTDTPHSHSYTSSVTSAPTCVLPGIRTYTCSCGNSYTEQIPATGHSWEVKTHQNYQYGSSSEVIQQGFTIYRCSICGEEYMVQDDSLPPGLADTSDSQLAEISGQIQSWYSSLRDLYQGVVGFLTDAFRYLPPALVTLIQFGIGSSFLVALYKKMMR